MKKQNRTTEGFWKSLSEMKTGKLPQPVYQEFTESQETAPDLNSMDQVSRRRFLALMSAGAAVAGTACTNYRDEGKVVPYNHKPEEVLPGVANYYASFTQFRDQLQPVLVKSREGRPIKVDANKKHPLGIPGIRAEVQASLMDLYHPERIKKPVLSREEVSWDQVSYYFKNYLTQCQEQNKEAVFLYKPTLSPSKIALLKNLKQKYSNLAVYEYDPLISETQLNAWKKCFGENKIRSARLSEPELIIAVESDFLGSEGSPADAYQFSQQRNYSGNQKHSSKLISIEGGVSLTGMNADNRIRLNTNLIADFILGLCLEMGHHTAHLDEALQSFLQSYNLSNFVSKNNLDSDKIQDLKDSIHHYKGKIFVQGGPALSEKAHIAIHLLNYLLDGNKYYNENVTDDSGFELLTLLKRKNLVQKMKKGQVGFWCNVETNPLYHFEPALEFSLGLEKVPHMATIALLPNETSERSEMVIPANHFLESWGDAICQGTYSIQQPLIQPLYGSIQFEDIIIGQINDEEIVKGSYYHFIRKLSQSSIFPNRVNALEFNLFWNATLHDGYSELKGTLKDPLIFNREVIFSTQPSKPNLNPFTVILKQSAFLGDGEFAGNGWLQEIPHPVSKVVWDNYAAISQKTAKKLDLITYPKPGSSSYEGIGISIGKRRIVIPAIIVPGIADDMIQIELGYGRKSSGIIANDVGVNAFALMGIEPEFSSFLMSVEKVVKIFDKKEIVSTQEHHPVNFDPNTWMGPKLENAHLKRHIIQEGTVEGFFEDPEFLHHHKESYVSMDRPHIYDNVKWAMAIDLNKCTGCSNCVVACNVENNIPVVGKDQVKRGREMSWIRIDRYYSGTDVDPETAFQPIGCQHCDNAPCENVCPVVATTHSPEGINEMTYNRCVGTRYCANNCGYKVRRFNFYNFRDHFAQGIQKKPSLELMHNPEVTVRSRGVMEKCTFCVHRVNEARAESKRKGETWNGQGVVSACQDACPTQAIVFGNVNDPNTEIYRLKNHPLKYRVLEETAAEPNVNFLAKLRNKKSTTHTQGGHHS